MTGRAGSHVRKTKPTCVYVAFLVVAVLGQVVAYIKMVIRKQFLNLFMNCLGEKLINQSWEKYLPNDRGKLR